MWARKLVELMQTTVDHTGSLTPSHDMYSINLHIILPNCKSSKVWHSCPLFRCRMPELQKKSHKHKTAGRKQGECESACAGSEWMRQSMHMCVGVCVGVCHCYQSNGARKKKKEKRSLTFLFGNPVRPFLRLLSSHCFLKWTRRWFVNNMASNACHQSG